MIGSVTNFAVRRATTYTAAIILKNMSVSINIERRILSITWVFTVSACFKMAFSVGTIGAKTASTGRANNTDQLVVLIGA